MNAQAPDTATPAARLFEYFAPLFSYGLELDAQIADGGSDAVVTEVVARAHAMVEQARAAAQAAGKPRDAVESAAFAAVAWFDEIVARNPAWWGGSTPLQVTLFNTNNAGNEFFDHLANLKVEDTEVREVYYHALLLGFVGQYYFETDDSGELGKLKALHARQLPVAPLPVAALREEHVTPQPYAERDPAGPRYPRRWDALLLKAGVVLAIAIPLGYLGWFFLSPARVAGPSVQQLVDGVLGSYDCADLSARVDADGTVAVSGYVKQAADQERLRTEIGAIRGVKSPSFDVNLRIWPHCKVVALLKPFRERNIDRHDGLEVTPTTGHTDRFLDQEHLVVKLTQANRDGYLYIDYYTVDGSVIHLFPSTYELGSEQMVPANTQLDVGAGSAQSGPWIQVGSPFGQELITVMTSSTPLYRGLRAVQEPAATYLPLLQQMIDAHRADPGFVANYMVIQTEPAR
jgi:type IV/VI secretion system ImpK/VasF family protein